MLIHNVRLALKPKWHNRHTTPQQDVDMSALLQRSLQRLCSHMPHAVHDLLLYNSCTTQIRSYGQVAHER